MRVTYDRSADAAYIYLSNEIDTKVAPTIPSDLTMLDAMINLDFDAEGVLIGIEVMDASGRLPASVLTDAESPGSLQ